MTTNRRLIEDWLPIREIGAEAAWEKPICYGPISAFHLWWARRLLVACRAARKRVMGGSLFVRSNWRFVLCSTLAILLIPRYVEEQGTPTCRIL